MNIYVGNLAPETSETELRDAFAAFGQVATATIIKDRFSGEPRGFAFVEMPTRSEAIAAIAAMNGKELHGRNLSVNEARPRTEGGGGGGGFGGGGRGGGGGRDSNRGGGGGNKRGGGNTRRW